MSGLVGPTRSGLFGGGGSTGLYVSGQSLWTPFALGSSLVAFWDASVLSSFTFNSGNVASWTDQKSGIVASQATASAQPGYSAAALNGVPGITTDASSKRLDVTSAASILPVGGTPFTSVVSGSCSDAGTGNLFAFTWGGSSGGSHPFAAHGREGANVTGATNGNDHVSATAWQNATHLSVWQFNGVGGTNSSSITVDEGTPSMANLVATTQPSNTWATIGGFLSGQAIWPGVLQTLLVINRVLMTSERQKIAGWDSWHNGKNGSNLPAGHPYKSAPPTMSAEDIERLFDEGMYFRDARYRRELGLAPVIRSKLYMPPRRLFLPERLAA